MLACITRSKGKKKENQQKNTENKKKEETKEHTVDRNEGENKDDRRENMKMKGTGGGSQEEFKQEYIVQHLAYSYESKMADPLAAQKIYQWVLEAIIPDITVGDLLSLSRDLQKEIVEHPWTQCIPNVIDQTTMGAAVSSNMNMMPTELEHVTPLREIEVKVMGTKIENAILDEGSKIIMVQKDLWEELGFEVNKKRLMICRQQMGGKRQWRGVQDS